MEKGQRKMTSLFKWIWHSFLRTALIPLVLVELVFISIYFLTNHWSQDETIKYLRDDVTAQLNQLADQEANGIQQQLMSISNATYMLGVQFERVLQEPVAIDSEDEARLAYSDEGVYYTTKDKNEGGAAIFYSGIFPIDEAERYKVAQVLKLQMLLKDIQESQPLAASLYLNTYDSLNIIYPYFDVITQYAPFMDIPSFNFYYEADYEHNPEKVVKWTDSYLDPAGHGWMASAIAPVYNGDFLEGVVGIDVTISTIMNQILNMEIPWGGYSLLVGKEGTILALPEKGEDDWGLSELTEHHYSEAIQKDTFKPEQFNLYKRENLTELADLVAKNMNGFSDITLNDTNKVVSWSTIEETGWKLLIIVPEENIYSKVNRMSEDLLKIGSLMIAGLFFFYLIFFYVLAIKSKKMSSNISESLLEINGIVQRIGEGSYYQDEPGMFVKELKDTSSYLIKMGQQLGNSNESLLETQDKLKKREADLQALVNAIDDVIIEVNENGIVKNIWNKDDNLLSKDYINGNQGSVKLIINGEAIQSKDIIRRVIDSGKSETIEYQLEAKKGLTWFQARIATIDNETKSVVITARDITQRKEMEKSIITAKEEAEKASKAKSQFLSSMSHELRTPLNAILGFSQVLEMDPESPLNESQAESVNEIMKAGKHLLALINEVLDLSKIESGKLSLSIEPIQIHTIMEETVALIKPLAEQYGIKLNAQVLNCTKYYVLADHTRIKQVLLNLLSNAIKYNRENGEVKFYCEKKDNSVVFNVIDNGYGISPEDQKLLYMPFQRINSINYVSVEGTGIGLTVAKQLIELMQGNISLDSTVGVGSRFCIELPIAKMVNKYDNANTLLDVEYSEHSNEEFNILYVEDNPANLSLIERILQNIPNINFMSAVLGELSIDLARAHKPDLILLDINLPGIDGYEVFNRLRQFDETKDIPVIAISANAMRSDYKKGLSVGFTDYIAKPIDVQVFLDKINELRLNKTKKV